jgi:hypothetical protein
VQAHGAPAWLQPTYELDSELAAFIGDFQERERGGSDNLWILKPWNMARSIDSSVTRNLVQVIRSVDTARMASPHCIFVYTECQDQHETTDNALLASYRRWLGSQQIVLAVLFRVELDRIAVKFEKEPVSVPLWASVVGGLVSLT